MYHPLVVNIFLMIKKNKNKRSDIDKLLTTLISLF